jgi:hypothetical protein
MNITPAAPPLASTDELCDSSIALSMGDSIDSGGSDGSFDSTDSSHSPTTTAKKKRAKMTRRLRLGWHYAIKYHY